MTNNPYEPPRSQAPLESKPAGWEETFRRIAHYQTVVFIAGIVLGIGCLVFSNSQQNPIIMQLFSILGIVAVIMVVCSIVSAIPLSVWGFIKGFREGRKVTIVRSKEKPRHTP